MRSFVLMIALTLPTMLAAQKTDPRYYELRIYYCHPDRLPALIERFNDHTTKLFEKHGMENIGYWVPVDNAENALYYVLAYPDKQARDASWKAFSSDPVWQAAQKKSEEPGKIVIRVTSIFMDAASFSPPIKGSAGKNERSFELRTYHILPGRKEDLISRFSNHTTKLFTKHGMTNIAYWTSVDKEGAAPRLIYLLAYPTEASGKKSWENFRKDPVWIKAKAESEKDHQIVEKVESVILKPLSFSKIK